LSYDPVLQRKELDAIRQPREHLRFQIEQSRKVIDHSRDLLKQLEEMLARSEGEP